MIQRIQSFFLLIAFVAMLLMFFFPIISYYGDFHILQLNILELKNLVPGSEQLFSNLFTLPLLFFVVIIGALSFIIIFLYKKRRLQLKLIKINILLNIILIVGIYFVYNNLIEKQAGVEGNFDLTGSIMPIVSLIFLVLSYRGVRKDERLIRSADRLR